MYKFYGSVQRNGFEIKLNWPLFEVKQSTKGME